MTLETRRLYSSANGDRWYLVRDSEAERVFVQYDPNAASGGRPSDIEVWEFLVRGGRSPEQQELLRLIGTLVEGASDA